MKKVISVALAAVLTLSAIVITGCKKKNENEDVTIVSNVEDDGKVYTPTFMYFVSEQDADYDKAMEIVEELKAEYGDKVKFDIHNIDKTPEDKENFPVDGQTPALIMLDTSNSISAFEFKCTDIDRLKSDINTALKAE